MIFKTKFTVPVEIHGEEFKATFRQPLSRDERAHEIELKAIEDKLEQHKQMLAFVLAHLEAVEDLFLEDGSAVTVDSIREGGSYDAILAGLIVAFYVGRRVANGDKSEKKTD